MPIIKREDGTIFTYANYRASLVVDKASLMKGEIKFLAQQHGAYVCVVPIDAEEAEGVFSRDAGYPLGEMIWDYFKRPQNLLYCEALTKENAKKAIVVVVREGRVFLDAILEKEAIQDEFASLVAENIPMDIKIFGDIPLAEATDANHFAFPAELVKSFTFCDTPAYEDMSPQRAFEMVSPAEALKRAGVLPANLLPIIMPVVIVIALIGYYIYSNQAPEEVHTVQQAVIKVDPFADYLKSLTSPSPTDQFATINTILQRAYSIPSWTPTQISYVSPNVQVQLQPSQVHDMRGLALWARVNHARVELGIDKSSVIFTPEWKPRDKPTKIYDSGDLLPGLLDDITTQMITAKIARGTILKKGAFQVTTYSVVLTDASPAMLKVLGEVLFEKPVVLKKIDLKIDAKGNYSGNVEIDILGK